MYYSVDVSKQVEIDLVRGKKQRFETMLEVKVEKTFVKYYRDYINSEGVNSRMTETGMLVIFMMDDLECPCYSRDSLLRQKIVTCGSKVVYKSRLS